MSLLELRNLTKRYGDVTALDGVSLTVESGGRTAVVGPSGSGKTTLLRLIAGFERPDAGSIRLDGMLLADGSGAVPPHKRNIGLVMQDGVLFPHLTVIENIAFGFERSNGDAEATALKLLDTVELPRAMAGRRPHQLSGGQQQRVALARALGRQPRLMLLDEPFSALDSGLREQMRKATAAILAQAGVTTILVTHDQAEAMSFADQIIILREGGLRQAGMPRDVYLAPADRETAEFLGQAIVLDAILRGGIATCALGEVETAGDQRGPATIMLRPEQIFLRPADAHGGHMTGKILAIEFAGPAADVTVALSGTANGAAADAARLTFRTPTPSLPPVGSYVTLNVVGPAHVLKASAPNGPSDRK